MNLLLMIEGSSKKKAKLISTIRFSSFVTEKGEKKQAGAKRGPVKSFARSFLLHRGTYWKRRRDFSSQEGGKQTWRELPVGEKERLDPSVLSRAARKKRSLLPPLSQRKTPKKIVTKEKGRREKWRPGPKRKAFP